MKSGTMAAGDGGEAEALLTEMGLDYEMQNTQLQTASGHRVRRRRWMRRKQAHRMSPMNPRAGCEADD